jgi:hypothetical protein
LEKETKSDAQYYANVVENRETYLRFLHHDTDINRNGSVEHDDQRLAKRVKRVEKVKIWLSGSSVVDTDINRDYQQQHANPCAWFLQMPLYCKWRYQPFDPHSANDSEALKATWQHRILFVQGTFIDLSLFTSFCVRR